MARSAWGEAARDLERAAAELHPEGLPRERMGLSTRDAVMGALALRAAPGSGRARSFTEAFLMDTYRGLGAGLLRSRARRMRREGASLATAEITRGLALPAEVRAALESIREPSNEHDPGIVALRALLAEAGRSSRE